MIAIHPTGNATGVAIAPVGSAEARQLAKSRHVESDHDGNRYAAERLQPEIPRAAVLADINARVVHVIACEHRLDLPAVGAPVGLKEIDARAAAGGACGSRRASDGEKDC